MDSINVDELMSTQQKFEVSRKTLIDFRRRIANGEAVPAEELAKGLRLLREMYGQEVQDKIKSEKKAGSKAAKKRQSTAEKQAKADDILAGLLKDL